MKKILYIILAALSVLTYSAPRYYDHSGDKGVIKDFGNKPRIDPLTLAPEKIENEKIEKLTPKQKMAIIEFLFKTNLGGGSPVFLKEYLQEQFMQDVSVIFKGQVEKKVNQKSGVVDLNTLGKDFSDTLKAFIRMMEKFKGAAEWGIFYTIPGSKNNILSVPVLDNMGPQIIFMALGR